MSMQKKKLLFLVNTPEFFVSHRLPVALAAKKDGYDVCVASMGGAAVGVIEKYGIKHCPVQFSRSGQNPVREIVSFYQVLQLLRSLKPNLVHLVTIKPVLYGSLAARFASTPGCVAAISGLGTVFTANSLSGRLRRWVIGNLYRSAFKQKKLRVIFQNVEDRDTLLRNGTLEPSQARMIRGSGVNLSDYPFLPEPEGTPVVAMAARLLRDKGVYVYVEAARILAERGVNVEMRLIGTVDPGNPTSVTEDELERWREEGSVQLMGHRSDIARQYAQANIVCLPSFYGEGLPKCLVEAAAAGRAVVTTDHPGCRDAIIPGETGVLVPTKNSVALADAIQRLVEDPERRNRMGEAGRALAEEVFAIEKIVAQHLEIYRELLDETSDQAS